MTFHPIVTPHCRLALIPEDMPIYTPQEIPNVRIHFRNEKGTVAVPYKVTGLSRSGTQMAKVAATVRPHLERQLTQPMFIERYGHCEIANEGGHVVDRTVQRELYDALLKALPGRTNINYRTHGVGLERAVQNFLLLGVVNGVNFRTWTNEAEFQQYLGDEDSRSNREIHGVCNIFDRRAYCTLSHDFFNLTRFTTESWNEFVTKRVFDCFPFMKECGLFSDLHFMVAP